MNFAEVKSLHLGGLEVLEPSVSTWGDHLGAPTCEEQPCSTNAAASRGQAQAVPAARGTISAGTVDHARAEPVCLAAEAARGPSARQLLGGSVGMWEFLKLARLLLSCAESCSAAPAPTHQGSLGWKRL